MLKNIKPMTIILIGAIVVIVGGIIGAIGTFNHNKSSSAKSTRIEQGVSIANENVGRLKEQNNSLLEKIDTQAIVIDKLRIENAELSHQLTQTALKLNETVIGNGDIDIETVSNRPDEFGFRFFNNSDLAVNNANITVKDYNAIILCNKVKETDEKITIMYDCYKDHFKQYPGINFNPKSGYVDSATNYKIISGYMNYEIRIETRKKTIVYHLAYLFENNELVCSYKVYNLINNKLEFERDNGNPLKLSEKYWLTKFHHKQLYTIVE